MSGLTALYDAALIDAGIILTRSQDDLRRLALQLDPASKKFNTTTTTNLDKLRPRLTARRCRRLSDSGDRHYRCCGDSRGRPAITP